jgi:hypothetical protein
MIGELVFVAILSTSPIKKSDSQTFDEQFSVNIESDFNPNTINYTQTEVNLINQYNSNEFTIIDFFANLKDLDNKELENYRNLLKSKKTIIQKSII